MSQAITAKFPRLMTGVLLIAAFAARPAVAIEPEFSKPPTEPVQASVEGHIFVPKSVEPTASRLRTLELPDGFEIEKFAEDLGQPRMLAVAENGDVYVTRRKPHEDVLLLRDTDGDGMADERRSVVEKKGAHGIAIRDRSAYLVTVNEVFEGAIQSDGSFGELKSILKDLPDGGQHPNRTLAFGPDGRLYITVGSTCNACDETREESATILRADLDAQSREIYASGLRNTIGFDWHPETGELWAMDHGIDWLGDDDQMEELNRIEQGAKYGWPYVYGKSKYNPADEPPEGHTWEQWAKGSEEPVLLYEAHAAPMDLVFYDGEQFPEDYRHDAFVTFHGSWNRSEPSGYSVARLKFEDGQPVGFEPFVGEFLEHGGEAQFGRPCGLAQSPDGALYLSDDKHGVIYRIAYTGG